MDESWWRVLTKCGPLEKGMANQFSIPALRTPWTVWFINVISKNFKAIRDGTITSNFSYNLSQGTWKVKKKVLHIFSYFSSVTESCLTLCNPMDGSTPGLPVHHQLQEFTNMFFLLTNYLKIYLHRRTKMSSSPNFFPPLKIYKYIHDDTGMLQFMGSQRVGHNWATDLIWYTWWIHFIKDSNSIEICIKFTQSPLCFPS